MQSLSTIALRSTNVEQTQQQLFLQIQTPLNPIADNHSPNNLFSSKSSLIWYIMASEPPHWKTSLQQVKQQNSPTLCPTSSSTKVTNLHFNAFALLKNNATQLGLKKVVWSFTWWRDQSSHLELCLEQIESVDKESKFFQ